MYRFDSDGFLPDDNYITVGEEYNSKSGIATPAIILTLNKSYLTYLKDQNPDEVRIWLYDTKESA